MTPIAILILSHTIRRRLDRADHLVEDAEPEFPGLHDRGELLVHRHHGRDLCALVGVECAERIFRGERDMVLAVGHQSQSPDHPRASHHGYSPRHSRISIMLRRSHVFTVLTGAANFSANCSRLQPL